MSWIRENPKHGELANVIKCMSINEDAMHAVWDMGHRLSFGSSALTRAQEEVIATVVSAINRCKYWIVSHGEYLREATEDPEMASIIMHDYGSADFDDETLAIVEFVEKLTREPSEMTEGDVQKLRQVDLKDEQILSVVLITSMFAFMNRLADGLGVEIEDHKGDFVDSWLKNPQGGKSWLNHGDPVVGN